MKAVNFYVYSWENNSDVAESKIYDLDFPQLCCSIFQ